MYISELVGSSGYGNNVKILRHKMPDGGKTLWKYDCKIIPYSTGINTLF